jgi:glutamate 5-kinase
MGIKQMVLEKAKTSEIEAILGQVYYDEVIHRDNLVILGSQE